jgi:hypothetical protein
LSFYRTGKYFIASSGREAIFPFLVTIYFLLANLSISFLLEFESFHWMLLITALFMTTPIGKLKSYQSGMNDLSKRPDREERSMLS